MLFDVLWVLLFVGSSNSLEAKLASTEEEREESVEIALKSESVAYRLHRELLEGYRRTTRPVQHSDDSVDVSAFTALYQIIQLDQATNTILLSGSFEFYWQDEYLVWDPDEYEDAESLYLDSHEIWIPEISLYYSHHHNARVVLLTDNNVRVNYTGWVRYYVPFTTESLCPTNVKSFPFDGQTCHLFFGSWAHDNKSVSYSIWANSRVDLRDYYDNQEWELQEEKTMIEGVSWNYDDFDPPQTWTILQLTVVTKRTSFYYVFNLVIPSTIIALVAVIGFHMPNNSGRGLEAKFRLGINTLLSMSLILLAIVEDMPHFSMTGRGNIGKRGQTSGVPLIGLFYFALLMTIGCSTITTSLFVILQRNLRIRKTLPWYLVWLARGCTSSEQHHMAIQANHIEPSDPIQSRLELSRKLAVSHYDNLAVFNHFYGILEDMCHAIKNSQFALEGIRDELVSLSPRDELENQWELVIRRLELISLAFYLSLIFIILFMFFFHDFWYVG